MTTLRGRRAGPAGLLACAILAFAGAFARADEAFDAAAVACAETEENSDAPDGTEGQHLLAAAIWSRCLTDQAALAEAQDLRDLALVSFRATWQHVLAAAELHRVRLLDEIVEDLEAFDRMAGVEETPSGRKVVKLGELAVLLSSQMQERFAAMGIPADKLPEFGAEEDRAARRERKRFEGLGAEYGDLLVTLSRVVARIKVRIAAAAEEAQDTKCTLTDPEVGEIGGGWVRYTVDGGPDVEQPGESTIRIEPGIEDFYIGSDSGFVQGGSYVRLSMEGASFTARGTHTVTGFPSRDPDGELRNFLAGEYLVFRPASGGNFDARYVITSGTVTLDVVWIDVQRGKRLLAGSFDVVATSPGGNLSVRLVGTFHLCRFKIEGPDGLY